MKNKHLVHMEAQGERLLTGHTESKSDAWLVKHVQVHSEDTRGQWQYRSSIIKIGLDSSCGAARKVQPYGFVYLRGG